MSSATDPLTSQAEEASLSSLVLEIKQKVWRLMDGETAKSLREKGGGYSYALGLSLPHLRKVATEYTPNRRLAERLLAHQMRELRMIGYMLFPAEELDADSLSFLLSRASTHELQDCLAYQILAASSRFDDWTEQLLASPLGEEAFRVVVVATRRRIICKKRMGDSFSKKLFTRLAEEELSADTLSLLLLAAERGYFTDRLQWLIGTWRGGDDIRKREFAEELSTMINEHQE